MSLNPSSVVVKALATRKPLLETRLQRVNALLGVVLVEMIAHFVLQAITPRVSCNVCDARIQSDVQVGPRLDARVAMLDQHAKSVLVVSASS